MRGGGKKVQYFCRIPWITSLLHLSDHSEPIVGVSDGNDVYCGLMPGGRRVP